MNIISGDPFIHFVKTWLKEFLGIMVFSVKAVIVMLSAYTMTYSSFGEVEFQYRIRNWRQNSILCYSNVDSFKFGECAW